MGKWVWTLVLLVAPLCAWAAADEEAFLDLVTRYEDTKAAPPTAERHLRENINYVFVAGYAGEGIPRYFADNEKELQRLGIISRRLYPPSSSTVAEGAEWLYKRIAALPGRLVIVGHSMGAARALAMALAHPDFILDKVEAAILAQGPMNGTPLVELFRDKPPLPMLGRIERASIEVQRKGAHYFDPQWRGLTSVTADAMVDLLEPYRRAGVPAELSQRLWYVQSSLEPNQQASALQGTAQWMDQFGPNDGRILLKDQSLPDIGTVLATFNTDHTGLVMGMPVHMGGKSLRVAFTRALVDWVEHRAAVVAGVAVSCGCAKAVAR